MSSTTKTQQNSTFSSSSSSSSSSKEDFRILYKLGQGAFATVFSVSEKSTGRKFAMKVCQFKKNEQNIQQIFRERDILRLLSIPEHFNPFIVRLYCTFQDSDALYFVLTLADQKDLRSRLKSLGGKFSVEEARFVMAQLCAALEHIHALNVVHRDVKPENILLCQNGNILLSDFGLAKILDGPNDLKKDEEKTEIIVGNEQGQKPSIRRRCSFVGTPQYVSPEVINGEEVTTACDWWAFGVILFELLAGHRPFSGDKDYLFYNQFLRSIHEQILQLSYKFPNDFPSAKGRQLIQSILRICPSERIGPQHIRTHPFFDGINWNGLEQQKSPLGRIHRNNNGPSKKKSDPNANADFRFVQNAVWCEQQTIHKSGTNIPRFLQKHCSSESKKRRQKIATNWRYHLIRHLTCPQTAVLRPLRPSQHKKGAFLFRSHSPNILILARKYNE